MKALRIGIAAALLASLAACATDYDYGYDRYPDYQGGSYGARGVGGSGVDSLDPWLKDTREGQALILYRFDRNYNGRIGTGRAIEANRWFRRFADRDRDYALTDREIRAALREVARQLRLG